MGIISHDVRYALRLLSKYPATSAAILLTLGLGIGANTAVFAVVNAVLLRPLPYPQPHQLVLVWEQRPGESNFSNSVSPADFLDWSEMNQSFTATAGYARGTGDLTGGADPVQVPVASVTARFFDVLGIRPALGRTFQTGDDTAGQQRVAIVSHGLWQRRFGGDPRLVGRDIVLNGEPVQVVGILKSDFEFPGEPTDIWVPLVLRDGSTPPPRASHFLQVYARLRDQLTPEAAQADMTRVGDHLSVTYPRENEGHGPRVVSWRDDIVAPARRGLLIVMAAVAFVMLIACTNVATLLLARSAGRTRELAIRSAIGAARGRLLRQSLTESVVLTAVGGGLGVAVSWWLLRLLIVQTPPALSGVGLDRARLDVPVLAFTTLICLVTALIAGALPAWQVARTQPSDPMRGTSGRSPLALRRSVRTLLIAGQVAMTVLLVIGAGLMVRTFLRVLAQPAGIDTANRLVVNLTLPRARYADRDAVRRGRRALDNRFLTVPGVLAFGANNNLPLTGSDSRQGITVEGFQRVPGDNPVRAHIRIVTPGYFETMRIRLREGRVLGGTDDERAPNAIVINRTMAERYWPGRSAIGGRMRFNNTGEPWREVVGVIDDVKHWGLDREVNPELYLAHAQQPSATLTYVFHTAGDPLGALAQIAAEIRTVDSDLPLGSVRTFDDVAAASMAARRWSALFLALSALVGIVLAAAGIYGVMSHVVALRTPEIGIRLSLGARPAVMLRDVLADTLLNAGVGVVLGVVAALAAARALQALLFDVAPADPATFVATATAVLVIAVLAALSPARRAMRVDPVTALRQT
jgi:putative ABC transport system permease protein